MIDLEAESRKQQTDMMSLLSFYMREAGELLVKRNALEVENYDLRKRIAELEKALEEK